jgi:hypothetical protein
VNKYGFNSSKPNAEKIYDESDKDSREEEPSVINITDYN